MAIQSQVAKTEVEELKEDVAIINSVRFAELRVVDVVNFNIVSAHMLLKLLFFQAVKQALLDIEISEFSGALLAAYEDKCALEHAEDCIAFVENVMVNHLPDDRGQEMTLVSLAMLVTPLIDHPFDSESIVPLFEQFSEYNAKRLCTMLQSLQEAAEHPCNRGNDTIDADDLFPHFKGIKTTRGRLDLVDLIPLLLLLHRNIGINCRGQQHAEAWMAFNDQVLQPFLRNNAAVNNWLDPHLFVISPAGPPTPAVAAAIASIRVASSALPATNQVTTRPTVFAPNGGFLPTPVLFNVTDAAEAVKIGHLLRHGPTGLPGPVVDASGGDNYQIAHITTTNVQFF